jgi:hypothetical protein
VGAKGLCLAGPPRSGETSRPNSRDPVASREEKIGEMHVFRGTLHLCIWVLFSPKFYLCSFADGVQPFCLTLRSRQFWSILSQLCRVVALAFGD